MKDSRNPLEVYDDIQTGNTILVGPNGRTHVWIDWFGDNPRHHTSFITTRRNREDREESGRWERI